MGGRSKGKSWWHSPVVQCLTLAATIFAADLFVPLGVAHGVLYTVVVLVALRLDTQRAVLMVAALCTFLILMGFLFSPAGGELWKVVLNRSLSVFIVWTTTLVPLGHPGSLVNPAEPMNTRRRFLFLALIMVGACMIVIAIVTAMFYRHNFRDHRAQLLANAQSQARLIEAVARHEVKVADSVRTEDHEHDASAATLSLIIDAHERYEGFGDTGEFTLARRDGDSIVFVLRHRYGAVERPPLVPIDSGLAEPMRRALEGLSGTVIGLDYRGKMVLAAYEPVAVLNMGIVAKIDLNEIRAPFIRSGISAATVALLVVVAGTALFFQVANPMIARMEAYSRDLENEVEERTKDLSNAQEELVRKERLAILGTLSGGVGHELRNPLGVISNAIYYLTMTHADADDKTREYLGIISSEVDNAEKIVSDLLDFSRVKTAERVEVGLSDLVDRVLEKRSLPEEIKVVTEFPADLPPIFVDPLQIEQVLTNLVTNACQAMTDGGGLTITAKSEQNAEGGPAHRIRVTVADTGCGISTETLEKIFEPLFTTRARGIGLGLSVTRNLVQGNGGSITVESHEGKGSTFSVILPTKEVAP